MGVLLGRRCRRTPAAEAGRRQRRKRGQDQGALVHPREIVPPDEARGTHAHGSRVHLLPGCNGQHGSAGGPEGVHDPRRPHEGQEWP
eukprot:681440-Pyramimonas_sp.AAC.1